MFPAMAATAAATFPVLLVWAGAVDIVTRSIPNAVVLLLAACFVVFAAAAGIDIARLMAHLLCAVAVLIGGAVLFSESWIGGGDAKLLAGAALWFGFENILPFLASVALAGGALALAFLSANLVQGWFGVVSARPATIPYGAAIAAGALAVLPDWLAAF
ncbi:MAG: prepilin peptidase [Rhodomicrobium sp.]